MIPLTVFLADVQANADRIRAYESGHDGSDGKSDCIGLIIGALKLAGFKWPGIHGSNWAARNAMSTFGYIGSAGELFPGEVVYKAREPWDEKYDLPSRYDSSGDPLDYYHVGVVTSVDPLEITHCTSVDGGIQRDKKQGNWKYGGRLKYIDYAEGGETVDGYEAIVTAANGKPVNMRAKPDKKSTILARVPVGTTVRVLVNNPETGWCQVEVVGKTGYMMSDYLRPVGEEGEPEYGGNELEKYKTMLYSVAAALEDIADNIWELLGEKKTEG